MLIKCLELRSFGKFKNKTVALSNGFNLIYGDNGAGKTTIMDFIRLMFYGRCGSDRSRDISKSPRKKYMPWDGSPMSGAVEFEYAGHTCLLSRTFGKTLSADSVTLFDVTRGENLPVDDINFKDSIGARFFGMELDEFERTVFISDRIGSDSAYSGSALAMKISNLSISGDESISEKAVSDRLSAAKETLVSKSGKKGLLVDSRAELDRLRGEYARESDLLDRQLELAESIERTRAELAALESAAAAAGAADRLAASRRELKAYIYIEEKYRALDKSLTELRSSVRGFGDTGGTDGANGKNCADSGAFSEVSASKAALSAFEPRLAECRLLKARVDSDTSAEHTMADGGSNSGIPRTGGTTADTSPTIGANVDSTNGYIPQTGGATADTSWTGGANVGGANIDSTKGDIPQASDVNADTSGANSTDGGVASTITDTDNASKGTKPDSRRGSTRRTDAVYRASSAVLLVIGILAAAAGYFYKPAFYIIGALLLAAALGCFFAARRKAKTHTRADITAAERLCRAVGAMCGTEFDSVGAASLALGAVSAAYENACAALRDICTAAEASGISDFAPNTVKRRVAELNDIIGAFPAVGASAARYDELNAKIREKRGFLEELSLKFTPPRVSLRELETRISESERQTREYERQYKSLCTANEVMREAIEETRSGLGARLSMKTREYLEKMSEDSARSAVVSQNLEVHFLPQNSTEYRDSKSLSCGQAARVYLALRLAAADIAAIGGDSVPLFLDDPFSQYDEKSCRAAAAFLGNYLRESPTSAQALFFTCHKNIEKIIGDTIPSVSKIIIDE